MQGLRVLMLGQGRVEFDGQALTRLMAPKHLALVYLLAAEPGAHPRQRLATLLWGDLNDEAARSNLRGALSRLRRWMPNALAIDNTQVRLAEGLRIKVDLLALRRALDAALPHGERVAAAEAWRGELLADFDVGGAEGFEDWLAQQRQRARREVQALRHDLLQRAEQAGAPDEALTHARALLDVDDADETAHMAVMRLLSASGRRTAAMAQYEVCRAALLQRMGARPSAACYALYTAIHAETGYRSSTPVSTPMPIPAPISDNAMVATPVAPPADEVADADIMGAVQGDLIGRDDALSIVAQRLGDPQCRWLSIIGPGGVGKTHLALAAAQALAAHYRHGVLQLSGRDDAQGALQDAETLLQRVLARVQADHTASDALLLVLDNLETVPEAVRFEPLLRSRAPGVRVLATSRVRVGGGREWLFELGGLSLRRAQPPLCASSPAATLFLASLRSLGVPASVNADGDAIERICELVGGLPLALQMAARQTHIGGAAAVAERLAAGAPLGPCDAPDEATHHHSMDAVMEASWSLLDGGAQSAALRLAHVPGAFDLSLASALKVEHAAVAVLRDHAWLARDEDHLSDGWLRFHPLQQAWLLRRSEGEGAGCGDEVRQGLVDALLQQLPADDGGQDAAPDGLESPLVRSCLLAPPILRVAVQHALVHAPPEVFERLVERATGCLYRLGRQGEAAALLALALHRSDLAIWRVSAWWLARAEWLDGNGEATLALKVRRQGFAVLLGRDVTTEHASWGDLLSVAPLLLRRRGWPDAAVARTAFGDLGVRSAILLTNALTFLPDSGPAMRAGAQASLWCRAARVPKSLSRVIAAWGAASQGHLQLASQVGGAFLRGPPSARMGSPRLDTLTRYGHCGVRFALGQWSGLAGDLDVCAAQWHRLQAGRQEMECRSLGAKLALYEGRLREAWSRFDEMSELAIQRRGESWRAWGPMGQCEVGLCLGDVPLSALEGILLRASQLLTEMENIDASYTIRRHGAAARLAWLAGDASAARDAVFTGALAAARIGGFGFWAHEGLAALGDVWLMLARAPGGWGDHNERALQAWAALERALLAHAKRLPLGQVLQKRLQGERAMLIDRDPTEAKRLLTDAARRAEQQGALLELARTLDALDRVEPGVYGPRAQRLWQAMRGA